jgi:hypothetical protein
LQELDELDKAEEEERKKTAMLSDVISLCSIQNEIQKAIWSL